MAICAIVGVGPRIGLGLSHGFAEAGYDIVMISRDTGNTRDLAQEVATHGTAVHSYALDATDRETTELVFHQIGGEIGLPDVVIYNPAAKADISFSEVGPEDVDAALQVMLYAPMNVVHAVLPLMRKRGSGALLFSGGGFGFLPSVTRAPHSIGKAAVRNYAHGLYLELKDHGIHAGTITVHRPVEPGEDMAKCAAEFVAMANEAPEAWSWERNYGE